jgi:hypothetical protein
MSDRTTARRIELILAGTDQASGVFSKAANNVKAALDKMQAQHGPFQPIEAEIRKRMEGRLKGMIEGHAREQLEERAHQRTLAAIAAEGGRSGPLRGDQIDPAGRLARAQQLRAERAEMMRREIGGTAYRDYYGNGFDLEAAGRRSSGTRRGGGGGGGGEGEEEEGGLKGFLKGAHHEIGRGSTLGLLSHLVHGGAIAVLGSTIEHATEKLKEFVETMHEGGRSASELTHKFLEGLPIVGDWAKAGANLRQALDGIFFPEREEAAKRKEEGQDNRDTRVKMQEARDAKRNALIAANRSAAIEAQDALNVAGKRGIDRTYAENQNTYDAKAQADRRGRGEDRRPEHRSAGRGAAATGCSPACRAGGIRRQAQRGRRTGKPRTRTLGGRTHPAHEGHRRRVAHRPPAAGGPLPHRQARPDRARGREGNRRGRPAAQGRAARPRPQRLPVHSGAEAIRGGQGRGREEGQRQDDRHESAGPTRAARRRARSSTEGPGRPRRRRHQADPIRRRRRRGRQDRPRPAAQGRGGGHQQALRRGAPHPQGTRGGHRAPAEGRSGGGRRSVRGGCVRVQQTAWAAVRRAGRARGGRGGAADGIPQPRLHPVAEG